MKDLFSFRLPIFKVVPKDKLEKTALSTSSGNSSAMVEATGINVYTPAFPLSLHFQPTPFLRCKDHPHPEKSYHN